MEGQVSKQKTNKRHGSKGKEASWKKLKKSSAKIQEVQEYAECHTGNLIRVWKKKKKSEKVSVFEESPSDHSGVLS